MLILKKYRALTDNYYIDVYDNGMYWFVVWKQFALVILEAILKLDSF